MTDEDPEPRKGAQLSTAVPDDHVVKVVDAEGEAEDGQDKTDGAAEDGEHGPGVGGIEGLLGEVVASVIVGFVGPFSLFASDLTADSFANVACEKLFAGVTAVLDIEKRGFLHELKFLTAGQFCHLIARKFYQEIYHQAAENMQKIVKYWGSTATSTFPCILQLFSAT